MWRLADSTATSTAADAFGSNPGTYSSSGVTRGQTGPFSSDPATSSLLNGGYVSVPGASTVSGSGAFSIGAWFDTATSGPIFGSQNQPPGTTPTTYQLSMYVGTDGKLHGGVYPQVGLSSSTTVTGSWHYAVLTDDGAGNLALYLDGTRVATGGSAGTQAESYAQIGAGYKNANWPSTPSGSAWWYFNGDVANVATYQSALSSTQISNQYQAANTATTLSYSTYDSDGRLSVVEVANSNPTTNNGGVVLYYDSNGRPLAHGIYTTTSFVGGDEETYTPAGRVSTQYVEANGQFVSANGSNPDYTYDAAGRLTQADLPGATYTYGYSATTGCPANNAGENTNRTALTVTGNGAGSTSYCYDNADRLYSTNAIGSSQITFDNHGNMTQEGNQSFDYNSSDQLIQTDSPGNVAVYTRDPLDRIAQQTSITPITEVATSNASTTLGTSISLSAPSGTQPGNLILASLTAASGTPTLPTGWTMVTTATNGGHETWVADHVAASGDPSSWSFGVSTPTTILGEATTYANNSATPIDVSAAQADASSTSQPLPQVTTAGSAEAVVHVVGYNGDVTPSAPAGDTQRYSTSALLASLEVSDAYQDQAGQSTAESASSSSAAESEAITVALQPAATSQRLGYTGQTDTSGFTQDTHGNLLGVNIGLAGGVSYDTTTAGATWAYTNNHGDTITTTNAANTAVTWTGYWGPYGENASGTGPPSDTSLTSSSLGYNGGQGKLTNTASGITFMGARPYQSSTGRFTQTDPIQGGCANLYTYAFGDPINAPDLIGRTVAGDSGSGSNGPNVVLQCIPHHHWWQTAIGIAAGVASVAIAVTAVVLTAGAATPLATLALMGASSALLGAGAAALDLQGCKAGDAGACVGLYTGLAGAAIGTVGIGAGAFDEGLGMLLGGTGAAVGGAGVVSDTATIFVPVHC